jgi:hypothetical protein
METEFHDKAIIQGKIFMYSPQSAITVVKRCRELNKFIYGLDAFKLWERSRIQPLMEYSIDYTSINYPKYDPKEYKRRCHVTKNADAGHWLEAKQ